VIECRTNAMGAAPSVAGLIFITEGTMKLFNYPPGAESDGCGCVIAGAASAGIRDAGEQRRTRAP
jgi:hypothetical protein